MPVYIRETDWIACEWELVRNVEFFPASVPFVPLPSMDRSEIWRLVDEQYLADLSQRIDLAQGRARNPAALAKARDVLASLVDGTYPIFQIVNSAKQLLRLPLQEGRSK